MTATLLVQTASWGGSGPGNGIGSSVHGCCQDPPPAALKSRPGLAHSLPRTTQKPFTTLLVQVERPDSSHVHVESPVISAGIFVASNSCTTLTLSSSDLWQRIARSAALNPQFEWGLATPLVQVNSQLEWGKSLGNFLGIWKCLTGLQSVFAWFHRTICFTVKSFKVKAVRLL